MKNITPDFMKCSFGACASVYELDDGRILIVGEKASPAQAKQAGVSASEEAIVIDARLIANVIVPKTPEGPKNFS